MVIKLLFALLPSLLSSACSSSPITGKPSRVHSRHGTDVNVDWKKAVLNVKFPENLNHLFNQKRSSCIPLTHVLVIHSVAQPDGHSHPVEFFNLLHYNHWCGIPMLLLVLNLVILCLIATILSAGVATWMQNSTPSPVSGLR
ncbi:hypothetical protein PanWU01x14_176330 [Parasponia andersonii]|uniref:Transmembrane protein n=1 Tax=Parasponia andersonii TaxID=3476 RepID=A0A2P5C851_PARAD|nr:hypothetical protein PanWU01x14_176330 [Parasponia andersonii]